MMFGIARNFVITAVALSGLALAGQKAQAASFEHIDRLALELRSQSSQLYWEFHNHFRHSPHARHLMADASSLYHKADHLHDLVHTRNLARMESDLREIDRLFHHMEDLVHQIELAAHQPRFGHRGHVHGSTRQVRRLMRDIENTIHHLQDDLRDMRVYRPVVIPQQVRPPVRVVPNHGGGVNIGNGRVQLRIGF